LRKKQSGAKQYNNQKGNSHREEIKFEITAFLNQGKGN